MKRTLIAAPPAAPITGTACAATFSETFTPKRAANCVMNLTIAGAPSSARPLSVMYWAASETDLAKAPRIRK